MKRRSESTPSPPLRVVQQTSLYYAVFFVAGIPALVYQVVWQRVLSLYFGVDIYSTSVVVAAFMLGLGLGSLAGGYVADRSTRPATWYMSAEFLTGCFGLVSIVLFDFAGQYLSGSPLALLIPLDFVLLLIPSTLMGTTLPLMCQMVRVRDSEIGRHFSKLYGFNTLGAAFGAVLCAYVLIGRIGLDGAVYLAAFINFGLAFAVLVLTRRQRYQDAPLGMDTSPTQSPASHQAEVVLGYRTVWGLSALSGCVGLGYEIVWYRLLGCLLHGTAYVFGTILGVYLVGNAAGSLLARRRVDQPHAAGRFAISQLLIAAYGFVVFSLLGHFSWVYGIRHLVGASSYTSFHPSPELASGYIDLPSVYSLLDLFFWTFLLLALPTVGMGYGLTNLFREGSRSAARLGRSVGGLYFANILGATLGTLLVGFVTLHYFGSEVSLGLMMALGCAPSVLVGCFYRTSHLTSGVPGHRVPIGLISAGVGLVLLTLALFPRAGQIIRAVHYADFPQVEYVAGTEDRSGVVVLKKQNDIITFEVEKQAVGQYRLLIDGSHHGGIGTLLEIPLDPGVELALAAHPRPRRALCIGLGDGRMCSALARFPTVREVVCIELNSGLRSVLQHTGPGRFLERSELVRFVVDDGRRWLLANQTEKFDVITMWPLHAGHAYSNNLFSLEFFQLLKDHLNDRGIVFLRTTDEYSTARTLAVAFPYVLRVDNGYVACCQEFRIDLDAAGIRRADFLDTAFADRDMILRATEGSRLNRDLKPNAEYYLTYKHVDCLQTRAVPRADYTVKDGKRMSTFVKD